MVPPAITWSFSRMSRSVILTERRTVYLPVEAKVPSPSNTPANHAHSISVAIATVYQVFMIPLTQRNGWMLECDSPPPVEVVVPLLVVIEPDILPPSVPPTTQPTAPVMLPVT